MQVTYTLYDASGAQIDTAIANINDLEPNGIWHFEAIGFGNGKNGTYRCTGIEGF